MAKNLVIVESPAKAKTISQFLGKDYIVKSSFGHIRDLPKKGLSIDIDHDFKPDYVISPDKTKIVKELKDSAKDAIVWLASDEDREGEAIAWHLTQALKLDPKTTNRIVFHEITKNAILKSLENPRVINLDLVDAQQARRILDRLVGYELSPILWKKIQRGLSAGRVQSVAVRLIVEREREIASFRAQSSFKTIGIFAKNDQKFNAELSVRLKEYDQEVKPWLNDIKNAEFKVKEITEKPSVRNPSSPFTTSTLQQEASRKLGFSVRQTMSVAQKLYENGHITYMRTDSTILSEEALDAARSYIINNFGDKYYHKRQYLTKDTNAQEAHEAIRPTNFNERTIADNYENKLYQLIWQRTLASQMSSSITNKTEAVISVSGKEEVFVAKGEVLKFDGFNKIYKNSFDDIFLPSLKPGEKLNWQEIKSSEIFSKPQARYSEAALVRRLEQLGIGRPSTYAPTISTIQNRGYVEKRDLEGKSVKIRVVTQTPEKLIETNDEITQGSDKNKLIPTSIAEVTNDFLVEYFTNVLDYDFTAKVEDNFDKIAQGKINWVEVITNFYKSFHPLIETVESISRQEISKMRAVGVDPKDNQTIYARLGRFGPMLQKGSTDQGEDVKPLFAPMPKNKTIETVTLAEALVAFSLPRVVGKTKDNLEIKANIGRFGPYLQIDGKFISIKDQDPHTISLEDALHYYQAYQEKEAQKNIKQYKNGLKILNGPYGPYVTDGKKNARIPKDTDPMKLNESEAKDILKNYVPKKRYRAKKK